MILRLNEHESMEAQELRSHLDALAEKLDAHDPNPSATWVGESRLIDEVERTATWLLDHVPELADVCEDADTTARVRGHVLDRCAAAAVLLAAAQRSKPAIAMLGRCAELADDDGDRALFEAGGQQLDAFVKLSRARWLFTHDQRDAARQLAAGLASAAVPIATLAQHIARAPEPAEPPRLGTVNGIGTTFYGSSDPGPDGSVTSVRFFTLVFIPIFPIDAWRVTPHGDDGYYVHGKLPLGPIMRGWRYTLLGAVVLAIVWALVGSYLDSPERKLRLAIDEVAEIESSDPEAALARYERLAEEFVEVEDDDALQPVADAWLRLATREIATPVAVGDLDRLVLLTERRAALPSRMQTGPLAEPWVEQLLSWADQIGSDSPEAADAGVELLTIALRLAVGQQHERVVAALRGARLALAAHLEPDWPLEALRQHAKLIEDEAAVAAMTRIIAALPSSPTLFADIDPELQQWLLEVDAQTGARARELLERGRALAEDPARAELLATPESTALRAALELDPGDQGVILALAELERQAGRVDDAYELIATLGKPGLMTHDMQLELASIESERGRHEQAASLLEQMLRNRLPAFEDVRRDYMGEFDLLRERLIKRAESGDIPIEYRSALTGNDQARAMEAFGKWLEAEVERSSTLARIRDDYARQSDIVGVALMLGNVQLQRARAATGEQRQQLLAAAESAFLAIREEAGGVPGYHVSLGQVYYRLGQRERAEQEFGALIEDPDLRVRLMVVSGYRDLGLVEQARALAESIHAQAPAEPDAAPGSSIAHQAALQRYLMAIDIDDREAWVERADARDPFVVVSKLEVAGQRLMHDGEFAQADRKFAEAYEHHVAHAQTDASAANNAAVALGSRHACTGDIRHIDAAVELMADAVARSPDGGIVVGNYADVLAFRAKLELLDKLVPTKGLRVGEGDVETMLGEIEHSSLRDELIAAVAASPRRGQVLDVWSRFETLSPQNSSAYEGQLFWHALAGNHDAMTKLLERLRAVDGLDTSNLAQMFAGFVDGSYDAMMLQAISADLQGRSAAREQSQRASASTRAVLLHLDGLDLYKRASLQRGEAALADARAAVESLDAAQQLWPEGLPTASLADALVQLAVSELEAEDLALVEAWYADVRTRGVPLKLHDLVGTELGRRLAAHPAIVHSAQLYAAAPDHGLGLAALAMAELVGDEALAARARAQLRSPGQRIEREIRDLLMPNQPTRAEIHAWIDG